jgi:hypothetical protein
MSDDTELYRVLYKDRDGDEQLTDALSKEQAFSRARQLEAQGFAVGSVMGDVAARGYMHARYAPTYRGVEIPLDLRADGVPRRAFETWKAGVDAALETTAPKQAADVNPFAPDLTMSREAADFILRSTVGLLEEGYWPKSYTVESRYGGTDGEDYDDDLIRRAADIVGRDKIRHRYLLRYLAELGADAGEEQS